MASTWLPNSDVYIAPYGGRNVEDTDGVVHRSYYGAAESHLAVLTCTEYHPNMGVELRGVRFVYTDLTCLACIARVA